MDKDYPYPQDKVVAQSILGDEEFVKEAIAKHEFYISSKNISHRKELLSQLTLEEIYRGVCCYFDVPELKKGPYMASNICQSARRSYIYLAREYTHYTNTEIAEILGDITGSGVSSSYKRTNKLIRSDEKIAREIKMLEEAVLKST